MAVCISFSHSAVEPLGIYAKIDHADRIYILRLEQYNKMDGKGTRYRWVHVADNFEFCGSTYGSEQEAISDLLRIASVTKKALLIQSIADHEEFNKFMVCSFPE